MWIPILLNGFREIQALFSSKAKRTFRKVTSLRDALVFMVANGDPTQLKDCKSWEKPGKPVVAQSDAAGMFDSLFSSCFQHWFSLLSQLRHLFICEFIYAHCRSLSHIFPDTPQKEKVDSHTPILPQTPSGRLRPRCKDCKQYMMGHDRVACRTMTNTRFC